MNKQLNVLMLISPVVLLSGCNTLTGVGRDVEKVGESIQKTTR